MCDLHPNCATVSMLESANIAAPGGESPPSPASDGSPAPPPPGFMWLNEREYAATIRQESLEKYYRLAPIPISEGRWASVYKCFSLATGGEYAAKFCHKLRLGMCAQQEIVHEVAAMRQCRKCPRIVQLHEVFETEHHYILVMEFGRGGDLQAILDDNQVPYEHDVIRFMRYLLEGLVFIHERNIAHLDIKPQNVVLTGEFPDCEVKLCDLEISRVISSSHEIREMLGTPDYVAPEILRFEPVTLTADIWSVGVLAYVLLTGFTPFGGDSDAETFRNISKAELDFPDELFEDVSDLAKDFIRRCIVKDPRSRLSARQSLMHPWLQQADSPAARAPSVHGSNQSIISDGFGSTDSVLTLRRSVSKSREVLCEKITHSQLKKNISKSRERLCDLKFGLSKSRERIHGGLRTVSKSSEVLSNKPPWRAAGVNCPLGKPLPPPMERMGSFKVRDQYQNQVSANMGSNLSLASTTSPFVRHCSLRRKKQQQQQQQQQQEISPADFRSSLRRHKNNSLNQRRNSLQIDNNDERLKDTRRRSHSNRDELDAFTSRQEKRRDSRREPSAPPSDGKNMIIVEIISDGEEEDVFTRLYKDQLKDSKLKWRKLRDSDFDRDDDEKENKKSDISMRRCRQNRSRSRDSTISRNGSTGSDEALVDRLNTLPSTPVVETPEETAPSVTNGETSDQPAESPILQTTAHREDSIDDHYPKRPAPILKSTESPSSELQNAEAERKAVDRVVRPSSLIDTKLGSISPQRRFSQSSDSSDKKTPSLSPERSLRSPRPYLSGKSSSLDVPDPTKPWRRNMPSPKCVRRHSASSPEPVIKSRRSRRGSLTPTTEETEAAPILSSERSPHKIFPTASSLVLNSSHEYSLDIECPVDPVSAEAIPSEPCQQSESEPQQLQDQSIHKIEAGEAVTSTNMATEIEMANAALSSWKEKRKSVSGVSSPYPDRVVLAAVVDEEGLWEGAEPLPNETVEACTVVAKPILTIEATETEQCLPRHQQREITSPKPEEKKPGEVTSRTLPPSAQPLSKSSTDEDVHRRARINAETCRSVGFSDSASGRPDTAQRAVAPKPSGYRRSSSLSSDLGSSEFSSETGSDSYCIVSWEEATPSGTKSGAAAAAGGSTDDDRATELKPVVTTRLVGRPRSHSTQVSPADAALLRNRGRSQSVTADQAPWGAAQPWGALCSGSVARAFQKFHSMSGEQRHKRRQSSPNITTLTSKVSDMGHV